MLLTFQMMTEFVPPETVAENGVDVTTFTAIATGEIVTEIPVTESVHEKEEEAVEVVPVAVVQVTAVLAAEPHEARLIAAMISANRERRFTASLDSIAAISILRALIGTRRIKMPDSCGSISTHLSTIRN